MNKNWKRQILIFAALCIGFKVFEFGIRLLFNIHFWVPWIMAFVIECAAASLIEHHLEQKENRFTNCEFY